MAPLLAKGAIELVWGDTDCFFRSCTIPFALMAGLPFGLVLAGGWRADRLEKRRPRDWLVISVAVMLPTAIAFAVGAYWGHNEPGAEDTTFYTVSAFLIPIVLGVPAGFLVAGVGGAASNIARARGGSAGGRSKDPHT